MAIVTFLVLVCMMSLLLLIYPRSYVAHSPINLAEYDTAACPDTLLVLPIGRPARDYSAIDAHALAATSLDEADIQSLAAYLFRPAKDDWERVRAIYRWLADRIRYDDAAYNSGHYGLPDAETLLQLRRGVCEDYANLFVALAAQGHIPSKKVIGFSKGFSSSDHRKTLEPDHAWNAAMIDSVWYLFDPTWGAGYGQMRGGSLVTTKHFEPYWFATRPEEFIFMHLPSEGKWQLLPQTLSVAEFECLPMVPGQFFAMGFSADTLLAQLFAGTVNAVPVMYANDFEVKVVDAPAVVDLDLGESMQMRFACGNCGAMTAQTAGRLIDFEQSDSLFCLDIRPKKGPLRIYAKKRKYDNRYDGIMEYTVRKARAE